MITVKQMQRNLTGNPERIERMMRVLPDMLREERIKPVMHRNIKVEKNLEKPGVLRKPNFSEININE